MRIVDVNLFLRNCSVLGSFGMFFLGFLGEILCFI